MSVSHAQLAALSAAIAPALTTIQTQALQATLSQQMPLVGAAYSSAEAAGAKGFADLGALLEQVLDPLAASGGSVSEAQVEGAIESALGGAVDAIVTVNGDDVQVQLTHSRSYEVFEIPLEIDAGLDGLGLAFRSSGSLSSNFNYGFDFSFGVDGAGFYIAPDTGAPELTLGIAATTPGLSLESQLGFMLFQATDAGTGLFGNLALNLTDPSGDGRLRLNEMAANFFAAQFNGDARLYLDLNQSNELGEALPAVSTGLRVDWPIVAATMTPNGSTTTFGSNPNVRFEDTSIDIGTFFSNFAKPVLLGIQDFVAPVADIINVVTTPIGFLQEMGLGTVTALDIAQSLGIVTPVVGAGIRAVGGVLQSIAALPEDADSVVLNLGDFQFSSNVDFRRLAEAAAAKIPAATGAGDFPGQLSAFLSQSGQSTAQTMKFPIVEDPTQVLKLLLGQSDAQLFTYTIAEVPTSGGDLPSVTVPVFPPVSGNFTLGVDFGANLTIGYDTYGLRKWAEEGFLAGNVARIFDGLYIQNYDGPEFLVGLRAAVGVAFDVLVAEAGFSGSFEGVLQLNLTAPDLDNQPDRVHFNEIRSVSNPYDLFGASGALKGSFDAYYDTIFTKKKSIGFDFTVFDFSEAKAKAKPINLPVPPVLGSAMDLDGTGFAVTAVLHIGPFAHLRGSGVAGVNSKDIAESVNVVPAFTSSFFIPPVVLNSELGPDVAVGGVGAIFADGGYGNDRVVLADYTIQRAELLGGPGDDVLQGGANYDVLHGGSGFDQLFGGRGNDRLFADSGGKKPDRLDGGEDDDQLFGGKNNDVLVGGSGVDIMIGGDGNDIFYVDNPEDIATDLAPFGGPNGKGIDTVVALVSYSLEQDLGTATIENLTLGANAFQGFGNGGKNTILGNDRNNSLRGNGGDDILYGGVGDDYIAGDQDSLTGSSANDGNDLLSGSAGNDELHGEGGLDSLEGGPGDDVLDGGPGNDNLEGGKGNDTLDGGTGLDTLEGGPGDDVYHVDFQADQVREKKKAGTDLVISTTNFTLNSYEIENLHLKNVPEGTKNDLKGNGNQLNNVILGNSGNNLLRGMDGNDTLLGSIGDDKIYGDDFKKGKKDGADELFGGPGDDSLFGGYGNDTLEGGPDNDKLDGGKGADTMRGGTGHDFYLLDLSNAGEFLGDEVHEAANEGEDTIQTTITKYTLPANVENLIYAGKKNATLIGTSASNVLVGGPGNDLLEGVAGTDTLYGGDGNDTYRIDSTEDDLIENKNGGTHDKVIVTFNYYDLPAEFEDLKLEGFATIGTGNASNNKIEGNTLSVFGAFLSNVLDGGAGIDMLIGGPGPDTLHSSDPGEKLDGGAGDDNYHVTSTHLKVTIIDASGVDEVFSSAAFFVLSKGIENLTLTGSSDVTGSGNSGENRLTGNGAKNSLKGLGGNDRLLGQSGNDILEGGDGADQLYGGIGFDTLVGGKGNDLLFGYDINSTPIWDSSNDTPDQPDALKGGPNNDVYYIGGSQDSVIELPNEGIDSVESRVTYALPDNVENLVLVGLESIHGNGNTLDNRIEGNAFANMLYGNKGKDLLIGGGGADILSGGANSDTLIGNTGNDDLDGGADIDTLSGGEGDDTYQVDHTGDAITELLHQGFDHVVAIANYTLPAHVESLLLAGVSDLNGTGNEIANIIAGNSGNNLLSGQDGNDTLFGYQGNDMLDGGRGADNLSGGSGDDVYRVDDTADEVDENDRLNSGGIDTVEAYVDYALPFGIENLSLHSGALVGSGNSFDNVITGNDRANLLQGAFGNDTVNGGAGNDDIYGTGLGYDGVGEKDVVTGGLGADRIFLFGGGSPTPFYDDRDGTSAGLADYLRVTDFTPADGDRLQYAANGNALMLIPSTVDGFTGLGIWVDKNDNDLLDLTGPTPDELLVVLDGYNPPSIPTVGELFDFYLM